MADEPSSSATAAASAAAATVLIPALPEDVALQCIARVPLLQLPTLSLVSKPWSSLLRSPHLSATRRRLRCSDHFLFLCLRLCCSSRWFTLRRTSPPSLVPLPPLPSSAVGSAVAAVGTKIYVIGGAVGAVSSPDVWIFDAVLSRWEPGPRMRVGREFAAAGASAGKVYAIGGCAVDSWMRAENWAEVLDPDGGGWKPVPSAAVELKGKWMHASVVVEGRVYAMADRGGLVLSMAADGTAAAWENVPAELDAGWRGRAAAVGGVLYCYDYLGKVIGFDFESMKWKELKGLENEFPKFLCGATMVNLGERLMVVWEGRRTGKEKDIMCAEIEVWKDSVGELWGSVVWSDSVPLVPADSSIVHCLSVEL